MSIKSGQTTTIKNSDKTLYALSIYKNADLLENRQYEIVSKFATLECGVINHSIRK